ncbi:MAG: hypothetical protein MJZ75_04380 [Paludibacteraceae bacterium]|nr:hypothetical protein [Paludibacteraceae bacterium]
MSEKKRITFKEVLSGDILLREWVRDQFPLLWLIVGLICIYILLGYQAQAQQKHLTDLQKELQDKHYKQLFIESEVTQRTRQSQIVQELEQRGSTIKENKKPVINIP